MTISALTRREWSVWISKIDTFIFDCDGVIWRGNTAVAGAGRAIDRLQRLGKKVIFVTNNSTKSRDTYVNKLRDHSITAEAQDIVTSASATADLLRRQNITGKIYVVGEAGLAAEIKCKGFECLGLDDGQVQEVPQPFTVDPEIGCVVVGLDRHMSYYKLAYASTCIRTIPRCAFIATNADPTYPTDGADLPGGGTLVKFIETAVGRPADAVVGKPSQMLLDSIMSKYRLDRSRTCMVGDRLSTDIEFGRLGELQTLLVLTGVTRLSDLQMIADPNQIPDYYVDSIDVFNQYME